MNQPESTLKTIFRGTGLVAFLTLISRLFGFIRDLLVAVAFGASPLADAFFVAFKLPNLLRSFVAEGALTSAFVPIFTDNLKNNRDSAQQALSTTLSFVTLISTILTIVGIVFAPQIVGVFAPGFTTDSSQFSLAVSLTRVMFPYLIFISLVALSGAALNALQNFGTSAVAQILMNLCLIVGALIAGFFEALPGIQILSYSVLVGGLAQLLYQIFRLKQAGLSARLTLSIWNSTTKGLIKLVLPALLGATIYQISQFVNTLMASLLERGSISWLFYADRVTQLPLGIFSVALGSVLLPSLARDVSEKNHLSFIKNLVTSLRFSGFILSFIVAFLVFCADDIVRLLFQRGAFTSYDAERTAFAVRWMALGLWGVSCHSLIVRAFIARKDTKTPTFVGLATLGLDIFLSFLMMGTISQIPTWRFLADLLPLTNKLNRSFGVDLGHAGLALSSSLATTIGFIMLAILLRYRMPDLRWGDFIHSSARAFLAALSSCLILKLLLAILPEFSFSHLIIFILLGCPLFFGIAGLIGSTESRQSLEILKKKASPIIIKIFG